MEGAPTPADMAGVLPAVSVAVWGEVALRLPVVGAGAVIAVVRPAVSVMGVGKVGQGAGFTVAVKKRTAMAARPFSPMVGCGWTGTSGICRQR